jgi:hypothetical protein
VCDAKIGIDRWKAHQIPPPVRDHHVRGPLPRSQQIVLTFNIAAAVSWEVGKFADLSSEGDATMILIGFRHGLRVSETREAPFRLRQGGP